MKSLNQNLLIVAFCKRRTNLSISQLRSKLQSISEKPSRFNSIISEPSTLASFDIFGRHQYIAGTLSGHVKSIYNSEVRSAFAGNLEVEPGSPSLYNSEGRHYSDIDIIHHRDTHLIIYRDSHIEVIYRQKAIAKFNIRIGQKPDMRQNMPYLMISEHWSRHKTNNLAWIDSNNRLMRMDIGKLDYHLSAGHISASYDGLPHIDDKAYVDVIYDRVICFAASLCDMFAVTVECEIVCVTRDIGKAAIVANPTMLQGCCVVGVDARGSLLVASKHSIWKSVHINLMLFRVTKSRFVNKCIYKLNEHPGELISDINILQVSKCDLIIAISHTIKVRFFLYIPLKNEIEMVYIHTSINGYLLGKAARVRSNNKHIEILIQLKTGPCLINVNTN